MVKWPLTMPLPIRAEIFDEWTRKRKEAYEHSIENFIGTVKLPVGLVSVARVSASIGPTQ